MGDKNGSFGFDMYPNRRSGKAESSWTDKLFRESGSFEFQKSVCERNVRRAFERNPLLRILTGALKKAGCPIKIRRHIVCEECNSKVEGGFDSEYNQIVVCQNVTKAREGPDSILMHELIHMYDYCANKVDFSNLEHLACTEIRAANLSHCSFLNAWIRGDTSFFEFKKTHQYCVKMRATYSLMTARGLEFKPALKYVLKVFDKCYNDLEPIGRRPRRKSQDPAMAYEEAKCFNICD